MMRKTFLQTAAFLCLISTLSAAATADQARFDRLANLAFEQNRATPETAESLMAELEFQQATQAYLWAMPLINTLGMKFGSEAVFGAGYITEFGSLL